MGVAGMCCEASERRWFTLRLAPTALTHQVQAGLFGRGLWFGQHECSRKRWHLHLRVCPCVTTPESVEPEFDIVGP